MTAVSELAYVLGCAYREKVQHKIFSTATLP
jgi:hypothetical protein